jgi:hypothetical protein
MRPLLDIAEGVGAVALILIALVVWSPAVAGFIPELWRTWKGKRQ